MDPALSRQLFLTAIGEFPQRVPLTARTIESVDCGSYVREKVEYNTESDEVTRAYLCIPKKRKAKLPAVFCHHQHDWNFALGKSEVVGLAGDPDQKYAVELAERGYITLAPDAIGFEERNWSAGTFETSYFELTSRLVAGRTLLAKVLHDAFVAIDYLESRVEVDTNSIGFLGHSYGGRMAIWVPAFDKRIRASVSNCGCITYKDSLHRDVGIQMEFCVPNIMKIGDIEDIVALVPPTALYVSAAEQDKWSYGAQHIFDSAKPSFLPEHLKFKIWPNGHAFSSCMRQEAYEFLDLHLL
jgi:dienelactone hydrolase